LANFPPLVRPQRHKVTTAEAETQTDKDTATQTAETLAELPQSVMQILIYNTMAITHLLGQFDPTLERKTLTEKVLKSAQTALCTALQAEMSSLMAHTISSQSRHRATSADHRVRFKTPEPPAARQDPLPPTSSLPPTATTTAPPPQLNDADQHHVVQQARSKQ
jgi:hypothetical protein